MCNGLVLVDSVVAPIGTRPPRRPLSSASLVFCIPSHALDLDDAALTPTLHNELPVELVLSDRLGRSPVPACVDGFVERSSCENSSSGDLGAVSILPPKVLMLHETEGVRDLSQDV